MRDPRLVVSIVRKGWGEAVLQATMQAGAHGGTVLFGRGTGRNEQQRVFGIRIEPEKEVVLTLVPLNVVSKVLEEVVVAAELTLPGHGLAFVIPVEQVVGVTELVEDRAR